MATKTDQFLKNLFTFTPNFWEAWMSRSDVKGLKRNLERLQKVMADGEDADKKLNIERVISSMKEFFRIEIDCEHKDSDAEVRTYIMEFRGIKDLEKIRDALKKVKIANLSPVLRQRCGKILQSYNSMVETIKPQVKKSYTAAKDEKSSIEGRLRDFKINELFAIYFQTRMAIKGLKKNLSRVDSLTTDIQKEADNVLSKSKASKPDEKGLDRSLDKLDSQIQKVIPYAVELMDKAVFTEWILTKIRSKFRDYYSTEKAFIAKLTADGFPKIELDKIERNFVNIFDNTLRNDLEKEYQQSRVMINMADHLNI